MFAFTDLVTRLGIRLLALSAFADPHTMAQVSSVGENLHVLDLGKPVQIRCCPATVNGDETCEKPLVVRLGRRRE